jgi:hypothetical protein
MGIQEVGWVCMDCILLGSVSGQMADFREFSNKPPCSIKCGKFLDKLRKILASQKGLCSTQLASYLY